MLIKWCQIGTSKRTEHPRAVIELHGLTSLMEKVINNVRMSL